MQNKKILIIDENTEYSDYLCHLIRGERGFKVSGILRDSTKAIDTIISKNPDIVIMDFSLSGLDGMGLLEKIDAAVANETISEKPKILIISSMISESLAKAAIDLGADYCLRKPVDEASFLSTIRRLMITYDEKIISRVTLEEKMGKFLQENGVTINLKGYNYLIEAVKILYYIPDYSNKFILKVYPNIALKYKTTPASVEKAMRSAIEILFSKGIIFNSIKEFAIYRQNNNKRMTNSQFCLTLVECLKRCDL